MPDQRDVFRGSGRAAWFMAALAAGAALLVPTSAVPGADASPAAPTATCTRGRKHLAMDLDGTLYPGGRLFPSTRSFL